MITSLLIIGGLLVVIALFTIATYNGLVRLKALVQEAWSGIDVQLKRRYDLIPNLVVVVKQYSIHEKEVLENVTKMRSFAMSAQSVSQKIEAEQGLTGALKTLFAVSENYPDLKANQNFLQLQQQLTVLEDELQLSRRYYNGAARNYNISVSAFPSNIIASMFGFVAVSYFEINPFERDTPTIDFK